MPTGVQGLGGEAFPLLFVLKAFLNIKWQILE